MFYFAIMAENNNTVQYTHIHANKSTKKKQKDKKEYKGTELIKHV